MRFEDQFTTQGRHIRNRRVVDAMLRVPREAFVPADLRDLAYTDQALAIGHGQTISQPYIVALMTDCLDPRPGDRILEVGTGSGYQAAILAELGATVYTIEIVEPLARDAAAVLARLGYDRVSVRVGDGRRGWPEEAPFDAVIATCAPEAVPPALIDQLRPGGRLIIPVGPPDQQELWLFTRQPHGLERRSILPVRFVPMTGGK